MTKTDLELPILSNSEVSISRFFYKLEHYLKCRKVADALSGHVYSNETDVHRCKLPAPIDQHCQAFLLVLAYELGREAEILNSSLGFHPVLSKEE